MNPKLKELFRKYTFSHKDEYDFMQIYNLMPDYKKVRAIENFESIAYNILALKQEVLQEHEILFGKALDNIHSRLLERRKKTLSQKTRSAVTSLKSTL